MDPVPVVGHHGAVVFGRGAVPGAGVGPDGLVEPSGDAARVVDRVQQVQRGPVDKVGLQDQLHAVLASEPVEWQESIERLAKHSSLLTLILDIY